MRFRTTAVTLTASMLAGTVLAVLPATQAAAGEPNDEIPRIVLDEAHQQVFLSTGGMNDSLEVYDLQGTRVGTIDDQPDAGEMALSPDGTTLYVAHTDLGTISAVSTTTLQQTALYRTDVDTEHLAYAGGRLWFGYHDANAVQEDGIGSVDVQAQTPAVHLDPQWQWDAWAPSVLADPADPNLLVVASDGGDGGLGLFDVSTATPVERAQYEDIGDTAGAAVTADGKDVAVPTGNSLVYYGISDLMPDGPAVPLSDRATTLAFAPDGTAAIGYWLYWSVPPVGLSVLKSGESAPRRTFDTPVDEGGLAWSSDGSRLYAVTGGGSGLGDTDPVLHVIDHPEQADTTMALTPPDDATAGTPYTVTGALTSGAAFAAGQSVHVTRTDAADPDGTALPDPAVAADGTFSFTDTASAQGDVSYQVSYDGDRDHAQAGGSVTVPVAKPAKADTTLWLEFTDRAKVGRKLKLDGRLSSPLAIPANATVTITRQDATGPVPALVGTRKVAADGTFQISDVPLVAGPAVYTVTYSGDDAYNGSTVSATVAVSS
ncbi:hypothetical protein SAMN05216223_115128 [Actinacidiphila yanglinensis]|uniref:Ig-like domain (Group 3) n=1 Tax=Actinacidiphila yanglinensis TaxID=310779 RepID=A0A1H6DH88_9ACTN|nr:hypothetical protein [Actinacidiphila yanglinensis]SEG84748.1 hypothetical protein SAMN05216223_115128 [Actinacidiphila yanglinensis]